MSEVTTYIEPSILNSFAYKDERLFEAMQLIGPISFRLHENNVAFFIETIIGQMLSNKVADTITDRLYSLCDGELTVESVRGLGFDGIRSIGISKQKTEYILLFCDLIHNDPDFLLRLAEMDNATITRTLTGLRGIGNWTAKMYLLFVLGRPDIIPYEDGAFLQAYKWLYKARKLTPQAIKRRCKKWYPYESIGARYLYRILDNGLTKYTDLQDARDKWFPVNVE